MTLVRLTHVTRRLVETAEGPLVIVLHPAEHGLRARVELRRFRGRRPLAAFDVIDRGAPARQLELPLVAPRPLAEVLV